MKVGLIFKDKEKSGYMSMKSGLSEPFANEDFKV